MRGWAKWLGIGVAVGLWGCDDARLRDDAVAPDGGAGAAGAGGAGADAGAVPRVDGPPADACQGLECPDCTACEAGRCVAVAGCEAACVPSVGVTGAWAPFGRGRTMDVELDGDVAYVATSVGLELVDVADPRAPVGRGRVVVAGQPHRVRRIGGLVYLVSVGGGVFGVDLADPARPRVVAADTLHSGAKDVDVAGSLWAVADGALRLVDASDPDRIVELGAFDAGGDVVAVRLAGHVAWLAASAAGVVAVDISDPSRPREITRIPLEPASPGAAQALSLALEGDRLYVGAGYGGVMAIDVADPRAPVVHGPVTRNAWVVRDVWVDGTRAFVATGYIGGVAIVDFADPGAPTVVTVAPAIDAAEGVAVDGDLVWVANGLVGLRAYSMSAGLQAGPVGTLVDRGLAEDLVLHDGLVYVADGPGGLVILDEAGAIRHRVPFEHPAASVDVSGRHAFVVTRDQSQAFVALGDLHVVDLAGPEPAVVGRLHFSGFPRTVRAAVDRVVISGLTGGLTVVDVADPSAPVIVGSSAEAWTYSALEISGRFAFAVADYHGLGVFDLADPRHPVLARFLGLPGRASDVALGDGFAFVASGVGGLRAIDVRDPRAPVEVGALRFHGDAEAVALDGESAWLWLTDGRLYAVDVSDPTRMRPRAATPTPGARTRLAARDGSAYLAGGAALLVAARADCGDEPSASPVEAPPTAGPSEVQLVNLRAGSLAVDLVEGRRVVTRGIGHTHATPFEAVGGSILTAREAGAAVAAFEPWPGRSVVALTADGIATAPDPGPAADDAFRVRLLVAAPGTVEASLHGLAVDARLGDGLGLGARGAVFELPAGPGYSLTLVRDHESLVLPFPALPGGTSVTLVVAELSDGTLYAVAVDTAGGVRSLGAPDHVTHVRFVNAAPSEARTLTLDEHALGPVAPLGTSEHAALPPGTRRLGFGGVAHFGKGETHMVVAYEDGRGVTSAVVREPPTAETQGYAEVRAVHVHPSLNRVDIWAHRLDSDARPVRVSRDLGRGETSAPVRLPPASYGFAVDADRDGRAEFTFDLGYFPDYGRTLILGVDADGHPLMAAPAGIAEIYWRPAREELAHVRVLNTGEPVTVEAPLIHASDPITLQTWEATHPLEVRAGRVVVSRSVGAPLSLDVAPRGQYTLVLPQGTLLDDGPEGETTMRVVNLRAEPGGVDFSVTPPGGASRPLAGRLGPGDVADPVRVGESSGARIHADVDRDGEADLSFALPDTPHGTRLNLFLARDADWPVLVVQARGSWLEAVPAAELSARVRVVLVTPDPATAALHADGAVVSEVRTRRAPQLPIPYGVEDYVVLRAGAHALDLRMGAASVRAFAADLAPDGRYTVLVYGPPEDRVVRLVDDATGPGYRATHVAPGVGPVDLAVLEDIEGAGRAPLVAGLAYGEVEGPVPASPSSVVALDVDRDGDDDWRSFSPNVPGLVDVYVAGGPEAVGLLVVAGGAAMFVGR